MNSQAGYTSRMLFQTINEDLNASMVTADELSREFNSLFQKCSPTIESNAEKNKTCVPEVSQKVPDASYSSSSGWKGGSSSSQTQYTSARSGDISNQYDQQLSAFIPQQTTPTPSSKSGFSVSTLDSRFSYGQVTPPNRSPRAQRHITSSHSPAYDGGKGQLPRSTTAYVDWNPSPGSGTFTYDQTPQITLPPSATPMSPYESSQMGPKSPRMERSPSPRFGQSASNTLPRNFTPLRAPDDVPRQKSPGHWNETDLDVSYERKPHHTYNKSEWLRPSVPNSSWRESNLDASHPVTKKDVHGRQHHGMPSGIQLSATSSPHTGNRGSSPYSNPQPIISRISIPPVNPQARRSRPIPLSVIMRLQNPHYSLARTRYPRGPPPEEVGGQYQSASPMMTPWEYIIQQTPPKQVQPGITGEVLSPGDIDAELAKPDLVKTQDVHEGPVPETSEEGDGGESVPVLRPLSPTRLQPVVAPESEVIPDRQELFRILDEIPRALKRRGSIDQGLPTAKAALKPSQYRQVINKLFHRKSDSQKGEPGSDSSSSSEGEESQSLTPAPVIPVRPTPDKKSKNSILRLPGCERKISGRRARLSPLVLLLDGALVGELEIVQKAVQEMSDPSQPNDEGITALHNAICGGHYSVVDFLVRIGANVSAPDSHGWTPLHCAASCNDKPLCEYLVRNGAAVMAVTESDWATASQKCDPYTVGFEECESFLRGVEEAMGVENSGVLYALWSYPAQAPDELSFREGDMVTILQKPEGSDWWWASLCGREGFVPNNYFGLFPKVRPKSLC
ncbi:relA-associated inhibitor [Scleropages formosus]|uniref:Protein phosphatase 1, regulatory subunit 13 like n=1 Tax=Scleropages formosus TaxID=113540 RepID=A0A8C9SPN3_SCLFO|nr:relA-associated inhibitor [Scleropages formosus]